MIKEKKNYLSCQTGLIENDKLYTVHISAGLLLEYDLKDFSYKVLAKIDPSIDGFMYLYVNTIIKMDNCFYLLREYSNSILEYNLETREIKIYGDVNEGSFLTKKGILFENNIWIFPVYIDQKIKVFNTNTKEMHIKERLDYYLQKSGHKLNQNYQIRYISNKGNKIYFFLVNSPYIIVFDMKNEMAKLYKIMQGDLIYNVVFYDNSFWCSFKESTIIVKWNEENVQDKYEVIDDKIGNIIAFGASEINDMMFSIHRVETGIILNDLKNKKIIKTAEMLKRIHPNLEREMFIEVLFYREKIIFLPFAASKIVVVDLNDYKIKMIESCLNSEDTFQWIITEERIKKGIQEEDYFTIKDFINILSKKI